MTILDIDLDAFVQPPVIAVRANDPRPADDDYTVLSNDQVTGLLHDRWKVTKDTPLVLLHDHQEILVAVEKLAAQGLLTPPFIWVHVDAHDDLYGHYSRPISCENFMYEVVRRRWAARILWLYPPENAGGPPDYIYDHNRFEIVFEGFRVPFRVEPLAGVALPQAPDYAFLCRSPQFTPPKADALYDYIAGRCSVMCP